MNFYAYFMHISNILSAYICAYFWVFPVHIFRSLVISCGGVPVEGVPNGVQGLPRGEGGCEAEAARRRQRPRAERTSIRPAPDTHKHRSRRQETARLPKKHKT